MHIHKQRLRCVVLCTTFTICSLYVIAFGSLWGGWCEWVARTFDVCLLRCVVPMARDCLLLNWNSFSPFAPYTRWRGVSVFGTRKPNLINLPPFASESIQTAWFSVLSLFPLHALRLNFASAMRDFSQSIFAIEKTSNINLFLCLSRSRWPALDERWMCANEVLCLLSNCLHNNGNGAAQVAFSVHRKATI